jgi:hypothetical protein
MRAWGHLWLAHVDAAGGRWRDAYDELAQLDSLDPVAALEYRALFALHPLRQPSAEEIAALWSAFASHESRSATFTSPDFPSATHGGLRPHLHTYLQALLDARAGDPAALGRAAAAIGGGPNTSASAARMAASLRALDALQSSRHAVALDLFDQSRLRGFYEPGRWSAFLGQVHERFLRAETLERLGYDRLALDWYESLTQTSALEVAYLAPAHLRRAQIFERLGSTDGARASYGRFIEL